MDLFEQMVLGYLARDAHVFVSPQYTIRADDGSPWSCPDLVALDFRERAVYVVEVSSAANVKRLAEKVADLENQWIDKLKNQLVRNGVVLDSWSMIVRVFIRRTCEKQFNRTVGDRPNVRVEFLEDVAVPWLWKWE